MTNKINIIDCTLRDGGYYNNWNFSNDLVNEYLNSISESGIEYVELGFRSLSQKDFKGPNWYTTDNYINSLKIPKKLKLGVMINMSEFMQTRLQRKKNLHELFKNKKKSKVNFVRIAAHLKEFPFALEACSILKSKGYFVCINLMQVSEHSKEDINLVLNCWMASFVSFQCCVGWSGLTLIPDVSPKDSIFMSVIHLELVAILCNKSLISLYSL